MINLTPYPTPKNELEVRYNIIAKYFEQWSARVVGEINLKGLEEKFAFVDLCAAWKVFENKAFIGAKILEMAAENKALSGMLSVILNEKEPNMTVHLANDLEEIPLVANMGFPPQLFCSEIDAKVLSALSLVKNLPTFLMMDIWNYQGADLNLLRQLVKNNGCDCLLIFDYQSISNAILKSKKEADLLRIFSKKSTQELQLKFKEKISAFQKEQLILSSFKNLIQQKLGSTLPAPLHYKFYDEKNKTSHFIFFITQNQSNYALMREILSEESQVIEDGIGKLEFNPNLGEQQRITSQTLFGAMFELEQELLKTYKSQTLQIIDIYENHHKGRSLVKKNYIDALLNLERKNKITITRKRLSRFAPTNPDYLDDKVFVSFNKA